MRYGSVSDMDGMERRTRYYLTDPVETRGCQAKGTRVAGVVVERRSRAHCWKLQQWDRARLQRPGGQTSLGSREKRTSSWQPVVEMDC
jgi:hypothetical protein